MRRMLSCLFVVLLFSAGAAQAAETPNVFPAIGMPGDRFTFVLDGFQARERVAVWLNLPNGAVSVEGIEQLDHATAQGRVSWYWNAPPDAQLGRYQMVAQGVTSGIQRLANFGVQVSAKPVAGSNIEPKQATPGRLVVFYASGFRLDEDVRFWANTPAGTIVPLSLESKRLADGRVDASWTVPDDAQRGAWQIVVHGVDSGLEQVLAFEVR